jgi:hypothetical protein
VGTGFTGSSWLNDFYEYDPSSNTWAQKANFTGNPRMGAFGFALGNLGYVGMGCDNSVFYTDFYEYNPSGNSWNQKASFPGAGRAYGAGFGIQQSGFVGCGYDGSVRKQDFWEWNQWSNTWSQKANYTGQRNLLTGFAIGNKGYFGLGLDLNSNIMQDLWEYTSDDLDVHDLLFSNTAAAYPNPFSEECTVSLSHAIGNGTLLLFDLSGKKVRAIPFSGPQVKFKKEELSNGVYSYQVISGETVESTGKLEVH